MFSEFFLWNLLKLFVKKLLLLIISLDLVLLLKYHLCLITRSLILIALVRVPKVINPLDRAGSLFFPYNYFYQDPKPQRLDLISIVFLKKVLTSLGAITIR